MSSTDRPREQRCRQKLQHKWRTLMMEMTSKQRLRRGAFALACALGTAGILQSTAATAQQAPREAGEAWKYLQSLDASVREETLAREARREGSLVLYGATGID